MTAESRALRLACRLVIGLLGSLQWRDDDSGIEVRTHTSGGRKGNKNRDPGEEPEHRVTFIGKPMGSLDVRENVQRFIREGARKGGGPPSVQTLVRGHIRNQPHGPGRALRKTIWIEPFWRGPIDAPILTRTRVL